MKARAAAVAAILAGLLVLAGCSTSISGSAQAGESAPAASESTETEADNATAPPETTSAELEITSETASPTPTEDTETSSSPEVTDTSGSELDSDSVAWLGTFCTGFTDVMKFASPSTAGQSDSEALSTIVVAYQSMSSAATDAADQLDSLPAPQFPGADTLAPAIGDWLSAVASTYADGAKLIANSTFDSTEQLKDAINSIESGMAGPNEAVGEAFDQADPSVQRTLQALPECRTIAGGG